MPGTSAVFNPKDAPRGLGSAAWGDAKRTSQNPSHPCPKLGSISRIQELQTGCLGLHQHRRSGKARLGAGIGSCIASCSLTLFTQAGVTFCI